MNPPSPSTLVRRSACHALAALFAAASVATPVHAANQERPSVADVPVQHRTVEIEGMKIFYREAGPATAPTVVLLHGFPTSSFMFRNLIPVLARRFHVIAPDYPGFGYSDFPIARRSHPSFEALAATIDSVLQAKEIERYAIYIQDYGAPVGLRLAVLHPERVSALIVQNGNAYEEGLSDAWDPLKRYWRNPSRENRESLRGWLSADGMRLQYVAGVPDDLLASFSPDTWTLDWSLLQRPGNIEMQLDLFGDYRSNVDLYPKFQQFFRQYRPPTLITWGRYDPFFTLAGARSYLRDLPDAELHLLDTGHFALETHGAEIARLIDDFLLRRLSAIHAGANRPRP